MDDNYIDYVAPYRRDFFRYCVEASAILVIDDLRQPVILRNLCIRGACVFGNCPLEVSKEITIEIVAFFDRPLCRKARVIWARQMSDNLWMVGLDFGIDNLIDFGTNGV